MEEDGGELALAAVAAAESVDVDETLLLLVVSGVVPVMDDEGGG